MIRRDDQGRQVFDLPETADEIGMTITDGATYRFHGVDYLATLEDSASSDVACFQRLPVGQVDDEPSLFLDREGSLMDDTGANVGDYRELDRVDA